MSLNITVITDTHYYSPETGTSGKAYENALMRSQKLLGGAKEIEKPQIDKLLDLRENYYKVTGKHPGYKRYNNVK